MKSETVLNKGARKWQGIPGIEYAPGGRLWVSFFSGGEKEPGPGNEVLLTTRRKSGGAWCGPRVMASPPGEARAYDPSLWHDPSGRLWLFYNIADPGSVELSVWAATSDDSSSERPEWSRPFKIELEAPFAFRLNKPIVVSSGEWILPVTWAGEKPRGWFPARGQLQGAAVSSDLGLTWKLYGGVEAPHWALENMIVELSCGRLWMLIRTGSGFLWESFSGDGGKSWSEGAPTNIVNPGTRFFIGRLSSGRLLFINTFRPDERRGLSACLGLPGNETSFGKGIELDHGEKVSYPDAVEGADGLIYAVHDRDRHGAGEIVLDVFSEDEAAR